MKTLITTTWLIVGLYGLLFLSMLVLQVSPDNDASGRGMMCGLLFLVLMGGAILLGLNLANSRTAKIVALVLGVLPILIIGRPLPQKYLRSSANESIHNEDAQEPIPQTLTSE